MQPEKKVFLNFVREKVKELFKDFLVPAHGFDHVERVGEWIKQIARAEGYSEFLAELAALLHDVGRVAERKENPKKLRHQELSYLLVKDWFLKDKEFNILTPQEKEEILYAVRYHWDNKAEKFPLAKILRDADKLDMYGKIGVERACVYYKDYTARRKNIEDNLASASELKTKTAKEIVRQNKLLEPLKKFLENNMKVLIVGSKGMLGQELVYEFNFSGAEVFSWDREEIDITNKKQVEEKINSLRPEIIINAAAYNAVDKIEQEDKELAEQINGYAVGNLAEAAKKVDAVLVHYSTDYVFDGEKIEGYKEDDVPNPQSVYAHSKWIGEQQLIRSLNHSVAKSLRYYLVRTSRLFGRPAQSEGAKKSFVDVMLKLAGEKEFLELVDEELSSPTYTRDLARRTREIIEWQKPFGIYHVTNSGACTWHGWARKIFELSGKNVKIIPVAAEKFPRPAKRPKYSILLNTKLPPLRSWEEALAEYLGVLSIK
jgi:dTDP-4-dehydrorhamnose reductase